MVVIFISKEKRKIKLCFEKIFKIRKILVSYLKEAKRNSIILGAFLLW